MNKFKSLILLSFTLLFFVSCTLKHSENVSNNELVENDFSSMTFTDAFKEAQKKGLDVFKWQGKEYKVEYENN